MKKKFYVLCQRRKYNGEPIYRAAVEKRFTTKEDAEQCASLFNECGSRENCEKLYRSWIDDPTCKFATEEWHERMKEKSYYSTYEVKESK